LTEHWLEILISALAFVSFSVLCVLLSDLKGQIKENSKELKKNTEVQATLNTKLEIMAYKVEGFEKEFMRIVGEFQQKLREHEEEFKFVGERLHTMMTHLINLWSAAHKHGLVASDEMDFPQRSRKRPGL
jgi:hypothetical protein